MAAGGGVAYPWPTLCHAVRYSQIAFSSQGAIRGYKPTCDPLLDYMAQPLHRTQHKIHVQDKNIDEIV